MAPGIIQWGKGSKLISLSPLQVGSINNNINNQFVHMTHSRFKISQKHAICVEETRLNSPILLWHSIREDTSSEAMYYLYAAHREKGEQCLYSNNNASMPPLFYSLLGLYILFQCIIMIISLYMYLLIHHHVMLITMTSYQIPQLWAKIRFVSS